MYELLLEEWLRSEKLCLQNSPCEKRLVVFALEVRDYAEIGIRNPAKLQFEFISRIIESMLGM